MSDIKYICKKFEEPEESGFTSAYESGSHENIPPRLAKMIEDELYFTQKETTKLGNSIEDYFYLKLKKCLKANDDFRGFYGITEHIQKIKDFILKYVKENAKTESEESNKTKIAGINLINKVENIFQTNSKKIQIDSFFPGISGKTVKFFYGKIDEYSYSSKDFINSIKDDKYYNLIVESTHCITSNLNKKRKQLERYFKIFTMTKKLYLDNQEMLKEFYVYFLKYFKIIEKDDNAEKLSHEELIQKSNFIYIICSNKNYYKTKLFQESMYDIKKFKELVKELLSLQNSEKKKTGDNGNKQNKKKIKNKNDDKKKTKVEENKNKIVSNGEQCNKDNDEEDPKDTKLYSGQENKNKEDKKDNFEKEDMMEIKNVNCGEGLKDKLQEKKHIKKYPKKNKDIKTEEEKLEEEEIDDDYIDDEPKKEENNSILENTKEKDGEKDVNTNSEENKEYDPSKYLNGFKNILKRIESENEQFLLVYLDSYDKLFIPYSIIKEGLCSLNKKYEKLEKDCEASNQKYEKLQKDYEAMILSNQRYEEIIKENNTILKKIRDIHPEFFN